MYQYDKDGIKENLSIDEIEMLVNDLNGEPIKQHSTLLCKTICHCGEQHKLYYYDNTKLFRLYKLNESGWLYNLPFRYAGLYLPYTSSSLIRVLVLIPNN